MRLPYFTPPASCTPPSSASDAALIARIEARRGPGGLLPLDRALLLSPPIASGWNALLSAVRTETGLAPADRELAICRVACLNGAAFEWAHHAPLLRDALLAAGVVGGAAGAERCIAALKAATPKRGVAVGLTTGGVWDSEAVRDAPLRERADAIVAYTDYMTREVTVPQDVFDEVRRVLSSDAIMVELTATVAAYNMVSRFLVALDVGEMNHSGFPHD